MKPLRFPIIAVIFGVAAVFVNYRVGWPNRTVIRNSSGSQISDVRLRLTTTDGKWSLNREISALGSGESKVIRHAHNDTRAELTFMLTGKTYSHSESYIDLWTGEGWLFNIQSDGRVESGYDYPEPRGD